MLVRCSNNNTCLSSFSDSLNQYSIILPTYLIHPYTQEEGRRLHPRTTNHLLVFAINKQLLKSPQPLLHIQSNSTAMPA